MIGQALRFAGQRLLPIVAPAGGRALAKEAALNAAINLGFEQGLPALFGQEAPPIERSLLRSATLGALSGPVERGALAGAKQISPRLVGMQGRLGERLSNVPYMPAPVARGLSSGAAATGKFGLGVIGMAGLAEPVTNAVTNAVFPEGYSSGQNTQTTAQADIPNAAMAPTPAEQVAAIPSLQGATDPEALAHQRRLELIYARNYKFPSYIHHVSSEDQMGDPFAMAQQMVNVKPTKYF